LKDVNSSPQTTGNIVLVGADELRTACSKAFQCAGTPKRDADLAAESLVDSNLRGIDTHGVIRLAKYVRGLKKGTINPRPKVKVTHSALATIQIDGDNGLGSVVASRAMRELIRLCKRTGVAAVGIHSSNHYGTVSYYLLKAAAQGLIGIGFVHGESLQAPFGGTEPFFGTNPLAFVFPAPGTPIVVDFATSATTFGRIMQARALERSLPEGTALDKQGNATTDPSQAVRILPAAGHKGYGLALAVEVFSAILNGCPFGPHVPPVFRDDIEEPGRLGHFFLAIDPRFFCGIDPFSAGIGRMVRELHESKPAPGFETVMVPGEPENRTYTERIRLGIPLSPDLWDTIQRLACT
jgi:ureidoglycolate dehydrogenase (NAD+)